MSCASNLTSPCSKHDGLVTAGIEPLNTIIDAGEMVTTNLAFGECRVFSAALK